MSEGLAAGLLDQRLTFQRATLTSDGQGGSVTTWGDLVTVFGRITPLMGREAEQAARLVATVTHMWVVRNTSDVATVTPKDRIACSGKTYQIVTVTSPDTRKRDGLTGQALELAA
jgi:SPP1 family predicted phage head-tail adaptor